MRRRNLSIALGALAASAARAQAPAAWEALADGAIVLFRHADAPGTGDPAQFRLGDKGRAQARALGERLRARQVAIGAVWTSQWCRTRETAELAFPGRAQDEPAFNSFFGERSPEAGQQTAAARARLSAWRGPGVLVVVTHQVNITALTGVFPASGEGVVLRRQGDTLATVGRLPP